MWWTRWLSTVVTCVVVACASPPDPPGNTVQVGVDGTRVDFGLYSMEFAPDPTIELPVALVAGDGTNLFSPRNECTEGLAGVLLYPGGRAIGGATGASEVEQQLSGPAVVRLAITFDVPYTCASGPEKLTGKTTYTFFPSGRIERLDEDIKAAQNTIPDTGSCTCGSGDANYFYSTFWAFKEGVDLNPDNSVRAPGGRGAAGCTAVHGQMIAVKYDDANAEAGNGTYIVFFGIGSPPFMDTAPKRSRSSIAIAPTESTDCTHLLARLEDPPLMVASAVVQAVDGIYVDESVHTSSFNIAATATIPTGFALEMSLGGTTHAKITKGGAATAFTAQPLGERILYWFAEPFVPGEVIKVEPLN